jgi:N-methylhydantoinase A/oxoprolinase/acetone carboxylase beta subunit
MALDLSGARKAVEGLAKQLNLSTTEVAWGVHEIANEHMATAARIHLVERGKDPASFTFVATGGAAPMHAQGVARKLGVKTVVIPRHAGVMSALGLLASPLSFEVVRTLVVDLAAADWGAIDQLLDAATAEAHRYLAVPSATRIEVRRTADMRYRGQGSECAVSLPPGKLGSDAVLRAFYDAYDDLYGRHLEDTPVQFVNFRVRVMVPDPNVELKRVPLRTAPAKPMKTRAAYFPDAQAYVDAAIYAHDDLAAGTSFKGPAIVQSGEFSALIGPGQNCSVDTYRNLVIAF